MEGDRDRLVIASLLDVFSRKTPLAVLDQLVAQNLVCHMDRVRLDVRRASLRTWFQYMHATMRRRGLVVDVDIVSIDRIGDGRYDVHGVVVVMGRRHDDVEPRPFSVSYVVERGRVAGVWSRRTNYVGVVGKSILFPLYLGYLYHCLRAWWHRVSVGDGTAPESLKPQRFAESQDAHLRGMATIEQSDAAGGLHAHRRRPPNRQSAPPH